MSAYFLALVAAFCFALGLTLQQRGTLQTEAAEGDPRFLLQAIRKPVWLFGGLLQASGWVLQALALEQGSLIVVQSLCALSLVFALPLGVRLTNQHVGRRSIIGAGCALVGILAFLAVGQPQGGTSEPEKTVLVTATIVIIVIILLFLRLAGRRRGAVAAALFGTAAGMIFGFQAGLTKVFMTLVGQGLGVILTSPVTWVLIVSALAGFAIQQSSLKTGVLAPAMASTNAANLVTSVLLGAVVFQESLSNGQGRLPMALIGLALAVFGVVLLASPEEAVPG